MFLGFAEFGDEDARNLLFNGSGGYRLERPSDKLVLSIPGLRFIATDQPGHGQSSPKPDRALSE